MTDEQRDLVAKVERALRARFPSRMVETFTTQTGYPAIADALDKTVMQAWQRRDSMGAQTTSFGDGSRTYEGALKVLTDVEQALAPYRRVIR